MIFLARLLFRDMGKNVKKGEIVFRAGISTLSALFALFHAGFAVCFAVNGFYTAVPVNLFFLALYLLVISMNRRKASEASGILFVLIPAAYAVAGVYSFGLSFGAQWYLLALIAPVYMIYDEFSPGTRKISVILLILSMALVYWLELFMPHYLAVGEPFFILEITNILLAVVVSLLAAEVMIFSNMLSRHRYKNKLANLTDDSGKDPLTGMWNRKYIENVLVNYFWDENANRERSFAASIAVNNELSEDGFKNLAQVMMKSLRGTDVIGRWDGGLFLAVLNDTDENGAMKALENFNEKVKSAGSVTIGFVALSVDDVYEDCIGRSNAALKYGMEKGTDAIVNYRDIPGAKKY